MKKLILIILVAIEILMFSSCISKDYEDYMKIYAPGYETEEPFTYAQETMPPSPQVQTRDETKTEKECETHSFVNGVCEICGEEQE